MPSTINKGTLLSQVDSIIASLNLSTDETRRLALFYKSAINAGSNTVYANSNVAVQIVTRLENTTSTDSKELLMLATGSSVILDDRMVTVANTTVLNALANVSTGTIYFVESDGYPYIRKSNNTWTPLSKARKVYNAWAWGRNTLGQLGDNTIVDKLSPVSVVGGFTDWVHISTCRTTLGIRANGTMWGWGVNPVGDNTTSSRRSPVLVSGGFTDWATATAGNYNSGAIRANGRLYMWGSSLWGRNADGIGTNESRITPNEILGGFTDWVDLHLMGSSSIALRKNGTVWGWGRNAAGNIGDGTNTSRLSPVSTVGGFTDWIFVGGASETAFAIRANGVLYAWGDGGNGILGDGTTVGKNSPVSVLGGFTDWVFATGGAYHAVGLRANGTAWSWGLNRAGSNGDGTSTGKSSPVSVVGGFTDWVSLGCAYNSTVGLRANGTLWAWGQAGNGELGTGNTTSRSSPVSVVGGFTDWTMVTKTSQFERHFLGLRA